MDVKLVEKKSDTRIPSHTPISDAAVSGSDRGSFREAVYKRVEPVFRAAIGDVPKENSSNSRGIRPLSEKRFALLWRPNNYRRRISIKHVSDARITTIARLFPGCKVTQKKLVYIRLSSGILLEVGRQNLTGIWSQSRVGGEKETFLIERESVDGVAAAIDARVRVIEDSIDAAIFDFLKVTGLGFRGERPRQARYEDWIKGEEYIDRLPRELVVHDTVFKKVYGEGIEFKQTSAGESPGAHVKNYIRNRAVEDVSPLIARSLDAFRAALVRVHPGVVVPSVSLLRLQDLAVSPDVFLRAEARSLWGELDAVERRLFAEWTFEGWNQ